MSVWKTAMCQVCTEMYRSSPWPSTLNTNVITGLGMCWVCTEAVQGVALGTGTLSQVWACVKYVPKQSIASTWTTKAKTQKTLPLFWVRWHKHVNIKQCHHESSLKTWVSHVPIPTFTTTTTPTQSSHSLMVAMRLSRSLKDLEYNSSWICCKVPDEALLVGTMMSTNRSNVSNHEPYPPIRKHFFASLGCVFEGLHHRVLETVDL